MALVDQLAVEQAFAVRTAVDRFDDRCFAVRASWWRRLLASSASEPHGPEHRVTGQLVALALIALVALSILPFVLDRLERGTVSPPAMVRHAVLNRRTSPEVAEHLVASLLDKAVAEVFAGRRTAAGGRTVASGEALSASPATGGAPPVG